MPDFEANGSNIFTLYSKINDLCAQIQYMRIFVVY